MDNQDFRDLFDAEGLYDDLQSNLESFYENFESLGKDLTKRERARRNQMYEEQMQQLFVSAFRQRREAEIFSHLEQRFCSSNQKSATIEKAGHPLQKGDFL